jgi:hypothetical protein
MGMRILLFPSMRIRTRILLRIKLMQICDHWHTDSQGLNFKPLRFHCGRPRLSMAPFEPLKLLNFDFDADPAPPFHFDADPDPASLNNPADSDPTHCLKAGFRIRIDFMRIRIRIRIQHFFLLRIRIPDPDPDPGFDDLKLKKIYSWKFNFYFLVQNMQFTYL